jgi:hypothetical protein
MMLCCAACSMSTERWYKGNTHTHTWWSDGDAPPEVAVKWYKEHGYNFLMLSDHNILSEGEKWVTAEGKRVKGMSQYEKEFPNRPLAKREKGGKTEYRLTTLNELRSMFEEPGKFLLVQGEEISDGYQKHPIHVNGFNLKEVVPPQRGTSVTETMQRDIDAVLAQRKATGVPMFPHVNHPNFGWGVTAEDMAPLRGEQFFEVFNGHRGVRNHGDETHISVERIWDVVLTKRLGELNLPVMYAMATDDAHDHVEFPATANPGRGWVMVQAARLTPEDLIAAMEKGRFYPSTGVTLKSVTFKNNTLGIEIDGKPGVTYKTQFIGTPRDYDRKVATRPAGDHVVCDYSPAVGKVLAEATGTKVSYKLTGNELYVRATITSSELHPNPFAKDDFEKAWTQPVTPAK